MKRQRIAVTLGRVGPGAAVRAYDYDNGVVLQFSRRLRPDDVVDGKLKPAAASYAHKGGKRITELIISPESEEALYEVLALRRKKREEWKRTMLVTTVIKEGMRTNWKRMSLFDWFRNLRPRFA